MFSGRIATRCSLPSFANECCTEIIAPAKEFFQYAELLSGFSFVASGAAVKISIGTAVA
jgi:hypothetical protein